MEEKRAQYEVGMKATESADVQRFSQGATLCGKCQTKAVILLHGCMICLNCGDSKCG